MIPPERTFRTSDTNSVRVCQELCANEGDRCQSFSLGISALGNGTCQLSAERISENAGRRPRGTLYDPDFNLYQRKVNCGDDNDSTRPTSELFVNVFDHKIFNFSIMFCVFSQQAHYQPDYQQHSQAMDHRQQ